MGAAFPVWKLLLLEMVGTFAMSFFGPATIVTGFLIPGLSQVQRLFFAALVPGVTLGTCIATFAKYSGSHVNPAITITFAACGHFRGGLILPYVSSQLCGALFAGLALRLTFDSASPSAALGSNMLGNGVTPAVGTILEIEEEILLCLVVLGVVAFVRGTAKQGAIVGGTLSVLIFVFGPISGGSMNPFRSLGPALFAGYFDGLYVYLIGPPVGAALAGLLFRTLEKRFGSGVSR